MMLPFSVTGLTSVINRLLPEPHAGLLAGLLFGTKASLSEELYGALVESGTLHIIALSGMNITIIMDMFATTLQPIVGKRAATALTLIGIVWFVWFVGASSTIVRAAIMGSISLIAVLFGRQYWALLSWMLAVGSMLLINLSWLFEISFQLSALATLGIILFGGEKNKGHGAPWLVAIARKNLRLTLAAQAFTIPLILLYFHRISFISPIANLAIGWLIGPLTVLGWATAVAGWIWVPLGQLIAWFDWVLLEYLLMVVKFTATIPFSSFSF